jgi:hypothetical protein
MAKRSLERDKEHFAEWRSQKHGREAIPDELWRIASVHIPTLGLNRVAQEFRLNFSSLRERAQQFGVALPKVRRRRVAGAPEVAFQELPLNGMLAAPHPVPRLVLERPDGIRVCIEGQLPDADYVGKLAACLSR